ncbi:MAG: ABC transporter permease [Thalassobaculales bacterium]
MAAADNAAALKADERRESLATLALTAPATLLILAFLVIPVGWLFWLSFIDLDGAYSLENYERLWVSGAYITSIATTFKIAFIVTGICVLLGYPVAYLLTQVPARVAGLLLICVLLPYWTSILVRTYAWLVLLQRNGLINRALIDLGLVSEPLALVHNLTGTVIGMVHIMLPFLVLPLYAAMRAIPADYVKAAVGMGATPARAFRDIFLPLSLPGLLAGMLLVFVLCLGFYVTPAVMGGGSVIMIAHRIEKNVAMFANWGAASALGVVLLCLTLSCLIVVQRLVRR